MTWWAALVAALRGIFRLKAVVEVPAGEQAMKDAEDAVGEIEAERNRGR